MTILSPVFGYAYTTHSLAERSQEAAAVIATFESAPDKAIPISLLKRAVCVATAPNVIRAGFVLGGSYGRGIVSCRASGTWSDPVYFSVTGGSWGLQIGVDATDLVMVFVNPSALDRLTQGNFTLGGDVSVAAGPLGRDAQVGTDYILKSEIYSYSRSRGLFAGLTLNGTVYSFEDDANTLVYGPNASAKQILQSNKFRRKTTSAYISALVKYLP